MSRQVPIAGLQLHPAAGMVPEMPADEYAAFLGDVKLRGVRVAIELVPGTTTVIDGRTRLRAAKEAGLKTVPVIDADLGDESPVVYMLQAAIARRHLTAGQRAALGVEIEAEKAKAAKDRQREHGKTAPGRKKTLPTRLPEVKTSPVPATVSEPPKDRTGEARTQAAAVVNVAPRYISDAKAVKEKAPELFERVKAGEMTLPQAKVEVKRQEKREELSRKAEEAAGRGQGERAWEVRHGDCVELLRSVPSRSFALVFADPPYNIGFDYGEGYDDRKDDGDYLSWASEWVAYCNRVLTDDGSMWVLINDEYAAEYARILKAHRLTIRNWVIWYETFGVNCSDKFNRTKRHLFYCVKDAKRFTFHAEAVSRPSDRQLRYADPRANPDGKLLDDVWLDVPRLVGTAAERIPDFPTQLPLALLRRVVGCSSNPGDAVLDPFNGSGTTGVAAVELGRRYVGIERNETYAGIARQRLLAAGPAGG